jgi:hypothetical protein
MTELHTSSEDPDQDNGEKSVRSSVMVKLLREFGLYIWEGRNFWLIPILAALLLVGGPVIVSETSPLSPFIYPFF